MDQSELRHLEHLCIQEEWAFCRAACPLHVDARGLCQAMKQGDLTKARSILDKTMPLASILGRICEAPCEKLCKRVEAGGAIRIGRLEHFCVQHAERRGKPLKVPDRGRKAIVVGMSLSGMTVASDLVRKGYRIRVYHQGQEPAEALQQTLPSPVPIEAVSSELGSLGRLGVSFSPAQLSSGLIQDLLEQENDMIFVGLEAADQAILPFSLDQLDPRALTGPEGRLVVGGFAQDRGPVPAIQSASQGRSAAVSIDRCTQQVSLHADRGREGPVQTRLVTSLEGVESEPPLLTGDRQEDTREAVLQEAERCLACECMICVRNCPYLDAFGSYPKSYARQIYNNESIVQGSHQANSLINSCMLCGLCTTLCPNDFPMADVCLGSRQRMVEKGKMPPSAHDFALKDLEFSRSEDFFLVRGDPEQAECAWLFFPGCQLCASHPEQVTGAYAWLRRNLEGGVGLALACCGAPARWSGRRQMFQQSAAQLQTAAKELGSPEWIVACPSCQEMLDHFEQPPKQRSLWDVLGRWKDRLSPTSPANPTCLVDPCTAGHMPELRQSVRSLVQDCLFQGSEPRLNASTAACCGYGGLLSNANPELGARAARERAEGCRDDAVTYCAMCRNQLARAGKRSIHLLDLFFPGSGDPFAAPATGLSDSRANRRWLKNRLLEALWNEPGLPPSPGSEVELQSDEAVRNILEQRRILDSDIQQVIAAAGSEGQLFFDAQSESFLASLRLGEVTFWVNYTQEGDTGRYIIHTAYSHRMRLGKISLKDSA
jgi:Fe-S oxidoreductase